MQQCIRIFCTAAQVCLARTQLKLTDVDLSRTAVIVGVELVSALGPYENECFFMLQVEQLSSNLDPLR